jgi:hypothetical protein
MSKDNSIEILTIHRNNLASATTLEEYRDAHVAYVDYLIEHYKAQEADKAAADTFVRWEYRAAEPEVEIETKGEPS